MQKKLVITIIIIFISVQCFSQDVNNNINKIEGEVLRFNEHIPIPYTSIGVMGTTYGTVSDTNGRYILEYPDSLSNAKIRVSCMGYADTIFTARQLANHDNTIFLRPKTVALKGVAVYPLKGKFKEIGKLKEKGFLWLNFGGGEKQIKKPELGTEIAQKFKIKYPAAKLSSLAFVLYHSKGLNNIKLRLKIYSLKNDLPGSLLDNRDIIVNTKLSDKSKFVIDLNKYKIYVHSDFVVSLQLLSYKVTNGNIDKNLTILIPARISLFNTSYGKKGSQDKWNDYKTISVSYKLKLKY